MGYMYAAIFGIAGLILIFQLSKENKIFYFAGAYFIVMAAWWGVDALKPEIGMFAGVPGIVFKVITAVAFVILAAKFIKEHLDGKKKEKAKEEARKAAQKAAETAENEAEE